MPPWAEIETVMFDMDGTLLDLHFDDYFWQILVPRTYSTVHGVSEEAAREIINCKYAEVRGTLDWYSLDYWETELNFDIKHLKHSNTERIAIRPNVEKLLEALQLTDKRVLLVTNAHPIAMEIKLNHTRIRNYFTIASALTLYPWRKKIMAFGAPCGAPNLTTRNAHCCSTTACQCCGRHAGKVSSIFTPSKNRTASARN